MAAKKVTGASVAIAKDGKIEFTQGFGYADLENDVAYQSETVNRAVVPRALNTLQ